MQFLEEYIVLVRGKAKVLLKRVGKGVKNRFSQTKKREKEDKTMNKGNRAFALTVVAIIAVFLMQSNLWGAAGQENHYQTEPNASGTKYAGPLAAHFVFSHAGFDEYNVPIDYYGTYFFVRLSKGNSYYVYSYYAGVLQEGYEYWVPAFWEFIDDTLLQDPRVCAAEPCPTFENGRAALKAVKDPVYNVGGSDPSFFIADIEIVVK